MQDAMLDVIDALEAFSSSREQVKSLASAVARYADTQPRDFAWAMDEKLPLSPHHVVLAMAVAMVHEGATDTSYRIGSQANDNGRIVALACAEVYGPIEPAYLVGVEEQRRTVARSLEISARSFELLRMTEATTFLGKRECEEALLPC